MAKRTEPIRLEIKDMSSLTDAEWVEINKLKLAWETGGDQGLAVGQSSRTTQMSATDPSIRKRALI